MLHDRDFSQNSAVDRYGRKLAQDDTKKQLERFYQFDEEDLSADDDEEVQKELKKVESRAYDPARDGGFSSSSSEEESSSDEEDEEEVDEAAEELDFPDKQEANVPLGEVTDRMAVVNLDWDNVRAEDLMAVFSSFLPTGGRVRNVSIYPSEFGKERIEREEVEGPPREIFASNKGKGGSDDEDEELDSDEEEEEIKQSMLREDEGEEFNSTQLRRYQLERLRYYYAILTFSSKEAAKHVYDMVDGAEYLSSANFFDLRFVPEDTDFSEDKPRDECDRIPDGYKPNEFVTDALQHSKVKLTWDADDSARKEAQARAFRGGRKEIDENDLKAYLGTDSSDDEEDEAEVVDATKGEATTKMSKKEADKQRMRALLGLRTEPSRPSKSDGPVGEMEVTFTSGLAGGTNQDSIFENEPERNETTLEKYIRKERERKKRRKEKAKSGKQDEPVSADDKGHVNDEAEDEGQGDAETGEQQDDLGFEDPFFDNPDSQANASTRRKEEKRKKRAEKEAEEAASAAKRAELELLMMDDKQSELKHFDMNEIEKAEKNARKKKGKGKGKVEQSAVDDFHMDVSDPRFGRLFESHEFAIDPTNPRYKATPGMKALLEEGRKRRRNRDEREEAPEDDRDRKKKQKKSSSKENNGEDLKKLVDKVKRKTQKS